jgi:hypothetical protein
MRQETSGFINVFKIYPDMFHLQGVVGALEAIQVISVFWASFRGTPRQLATPVGS